MTQRYNTGNFSIVGLRNEVSFALGNVEMSMMEPYLTFGPEVVSQRAIPN